VWSSADGSTNGVLIFQGMRSYKPGVNMEGLFRSARAGPVRNIGRLGGKIGARLTGIVRLRFEDAGNNSALAEDINVGFQGISSHHG